MFMSGDVSTILFFVPRQHLLHIFYDFSERWVHSKHFIVKSSTFFSSVLPRLQLQLLYFVFLFNILALPLVSMLTIVELYL